MSAETLQFHKFKVGDVVVLTNNPGPEAFRVLEVYKHSMVLLAENPPWLVNTSELKLLRRGQS